MTAVDESAPVEAPARGADSHQWAAIGLTVLLLVTIIALFVLSGGDASAAGGCGGG